MKKTLACSVALIALGFSAPLKAERVYVPVVDVQGADGKPLATQLWISNFDGVERPYSSVFLKSETDGTELSGRGVAARVPANKAAYLKRAAAEGETGLLEIDRDEMAVNAWIQTSRGRRTFYTGVPVISESTRVEAGGTAYLNGLGRQADREVRSLALVNVAGEAASCQVNFLKTDGTAIGAGVAVDVPALSMRPFADALGLLSEPEARSARVSCDQPFYAYALTIDRETSAISFTTPEQEFTTKARQTSGGKAGESGAIVFTQDGLFHLATKQAAKQILRVPVPKQMGMAIVTAEFDIVAGPWNPRQKSGAHNLIFFHRGRFRGNTLANVNALGPSKFLFKINQNLDMPPRANTKAEIGFTFVQGKTYHVRITSNAVTNRISCVLSEDGQVVRRMEFSGSARSQEIAVPASGLIAEFGNYNNQALPEVSSLGWRFLNFRAEMVPK
ncbi:MAG TPA: hypothetical protein VHC97_12360 [Thermoanaerobaculia bacterium]|jgi:hypothetical protein|nr:hypothetical protein [Thermoanaerobaculia bacterium]